MHTSCPLYHTNDNLWPLLHAPIHLDQGGELSEGARFFLYLDEDWEDAMDAPTCEERLSYAKWQSATLRTGPPLRHAVSQVGWIASL